MFRALGEAHPPVLNQLEPGQAINPPEVLFSKITDEQVAELKARFGGVQ